jgi:uncharacterized protein (DUF2267 family)
MGQTIIQINDLIDQHGDTFTQCKGCSTCTKIQTLRNQMRNVSKINKLLNKGQDMTKSDIAYLISRDVKKGDIKKAMKIGSMEFHDLMVNWGFRKKKGMGRLPKLEMSVEEYKGYKEKGMSDKKVAEEKGVAAGTIDYWKKKHHISSYSDLIKKETNSHRKEKEQPQEDYRSVIDSLKRELEVREKAVKDLEERIEDEYVPKKNFEEQANQVSFYETKWLEEMKEKTKFGEGYNKEYSARRLLDAELENIREQLRKAEGLNEVYKQENEHLRGLIRIWI